MVVELVPSVSDACRSLLCQVYLGGYQDEADAARAYDRAALTYFGRETGLNVSWAGVNGV